MNIIKVKDYEEMSEKACQIIVKKLKNATQPVLGLATGSTPERLYEKLIEKYQQKEISFQSATTFNLDEYVGLEKNDPNSYYYYMYEKFFKYIDISSERTHLPNGAAVDPEKECRDYEQLMKEHQGIDIQVLGLGVNGHIGFNEPGTSFDSRTHIVKLDESTREANARFFTSIDDVPTEAITMGIATIMESKEILLLVSGEKKADAVAKIISGEVTTDVPGTVLQNHPNVTLIADEAALSKVK